MASFFYVHLWIDKANRKTNRKTKIHQKFTWKARTNMINLWWEKGNYKKMFVFWLRCKAKKN